MSSKYSFPLIELIYKGNGGLTNPRLNLAIMISEYINYLVFTKGYSENTARLYDIALHSFAKAMAGRKWSEISHDDITNYLIIKKANGASNNTIVAYISAIRGLFNWMSRNYPLQENPAKYIESPKKEKTIPHILNADDIIKAVQQEQNQDIKLAIMIMVSTGMRVSETRNLKYEQINMGNSQAVVMGKGRKERTIFFPSYILESIKLRGKQEGEIFAGWQDREFRYAIFLAFDRIGIKMSPHLLRHTFASNAINRGMRLDVLREILGHTSISTTQIYMHTNNIAMQSEYNRTIN